MKLAMARMELLAVPHMIVVVISILGHAFSNSRGLGEVQVRDFAKVLQTSLGNELLIQGRVLRGTDL